jgi:hypothetical protein
MKTIDEALMALVINLAAFFEFCEDDVVRHDAAIRQLEEIAAALDDLTYEDAKTFAEYVQRRIVEEQQGENRSEYVKFLQSYFLEPFLEMLEEERDSPD